MRWYERSSAKNNKVLTPTGMVLVTSGYTKSRKKRLTGAASHRPPMSAFLSDPRRCAISATASACRLMVAALARTRARRRHADQHTHTATMARLTATGATPTITISL